MKLVWLCRYSLEFFFRGFISSTLRWNCSLIVIWSSFAPVIQPTGDVTVYWPHPPFALLFNFAGFKFDFDPSRSLASFLSMCTLSLTPSNDSVFPCRFEMRSLLVNNEDLLRTNTQLTNEMKRMREQMIEMEREIQTMGEKYRAMEVCVAGWMDGCMVL